jgi:AraC-like DNA-binding protein
MIPAPDRLLAGYTVLRTHDADVLHAYIAGMEGRHTRNVVSKGPIVIELRHASLGTLDVAMQYSSAKITVSTTRRKSDCFLIQFPLSGGIDLEVNDREFSVEPGAGLVMSPSQRVRRTGRPGWTLAFRIPGDTMRARLEARLGRALRGDLAFHPRIGVGAAEVLAYALIVVDALDRGTATAGGSVAAVLEEGFVSLLLDIQPHSQGARLSRSEVAARAARVRAVAAHVDQHLDQPLTVAALAKVAGCSARSLQATFRELCGLTPMEYVLHRRLSAARSVLEAGDGDARVSDVALRSGFSHLARFAARYKARYGESPSQTRRRALARPTRQRS